jgi:hypothetical protein
MALAVHGMGRPSAGLAMSNLEIDLDGHGLSW